MSMSIFISYMKKFALHSLLVTVAGLTAALLPSNILAAPGDLFETDQGSSTIFKFTPVGGQSTFATGLGGPFGVAVDAFGNVLEADFNTGTIFHFTSAGVKSTVASRLNTPPGLAFDASGNLFEADQASGTIFKFTPAGVKSSFASGLNAPSGLAFEPATAQLTNISTRASVQTGQGVTIAGFIVTGTDSKTVVVRGLGPTLGQPPFNLTGVLADPFLQLFDGNNTLLYSNNDWKDSQQTQIQNLGPACDGHTCGPPNDLESAILRTVAPGNYTAILSGRNGTTGIGLVEVYKLK